MAILSFHPVKHLTTGEGGAITTNDDALADNLRVLRGDAVDLLTDHIAPASLHGVRIFFPDPWPKKRHHRRRLVQPEFARVAAERLARGALWRLATDWPDYAEQMAAVLDAEPALEGGVVERWTERPSTRFERRGIRAGRPIVDLCYRRA